MTLDNMIKIKTSVAMMGALLLLQSNMVFSEQVYDMVYIEQGKQSMDVIYQYFDGNKWSRAVNVSEQNKLDDFTPVVIQYQQQRRMLVWVESTGVETSRLRFRHYGGEAWSEAGEIQSLTAHSSLPTLLVDQENRVWCFWVGFDGSDDEIYFSVYQSAQWQAPMKLYAEDNNVPDILPVARLNRQDQLVVTWKRLDNQEWLYKLVRSTLLPVHDSDVGDNKKVAWSKVSPVVANPFDSITLPVEFEVPKQVTRPDTVALYFPSMPNHVIQLNRVK